MAFQVPNQATAQQAQPLTNVAKFAHIQKEVEQFLGGVNVNDPNQIFATESRGVSDVFELNKFTACTFVADSSENTLEWAQSGQWQYGQARITVNVKGQLETVPVDSEQASCLFITALQNDGNVPQLFAHATLRERKPDSNGNPRSPLKVLTFYSKPELSKAVKIQFVKANGKVDTNFVVTGW